MVEVKVEGVEKVSQTMKKFRSDLKGENFKKMTEASVYLMNYVQRNKLSGQVLKRRTGRLVGGMGYTVKDEYGNIVGRVGDKVVYAAIHETGGTIRPKTAKFLTIPLAAALTPAGVLRKPARQWNNTYVAGGIIWQAKEKGQMSIPLFVLKRSVTIPARPYMGPALEETKEHIFKILGQAVETAVTIANRGHG